MSTKQARLGIVLFTTYLLIYTAFVLVNAFAPETMTRTIGGLNLAIISGFGLIGVALGMACVYGLMTRPGRQSGGWS